MSLNGFLNFPLQLLCRESDGIEIGLPVIGIVFRSSCWAILCCDIKFSHRQVDRLHCFVCPAINNFLSQMWCGSFTFHKSYGHYKSKSREPGKQCQHFRHRWAIQGISFIFPSSKLEEEISRTHTINRADRDRITPPGRIFRITDDVVFVVGSFRFMCRAGDSTRSWMNWQITYMRCSKMSLHLMHNYLLHGFKKLAQQGLFSQTFQS